MNSKKILLGVVGTALIAVLLNSCYNDSKEALYPAAPVVSCDTTNITYSLTIEPILVSKCANNSGCHDAAGRSISGYDFTTYADANQAAVGDNLMLDAINHVGVGVSEPMPKDEDMLDACTINKITIWVKSGAPNN